MKTYLSSIPMRIYRYARRTPEKIAVIDSDFQTYTYRELNSKADAIKKMFPVESPSRVGILTGAGINQISAILAIVKNGGAYVPLDPALNGASLRRAALKAGVDFVIADSNNATRLGDIPAIVLPDVIVADASEGYAPLDFGQKTVACAMPSSGDKFEELSSVAVRKHARYLCDEFGIKSTDTVLQSSVASSQMFLAEVFATMMKGATLAILPEKNRGYAKAVADFAERAGVTIICGYRPMVDDIGLLKRLPSKLRLLLCTASGRLSNTLSTFNTKNTWREWLAARRLRIANT